MILPAGVSEGQGLFDALGELGGSHHNMIAVGDAENDLALLEVAEVGVATGNAVPSLKTHADLVLDLPDGAGVRALLRGPFLSGQRRLCPARHWIRVGEFPDGRPVTVPGSQPNILIEGETGRGKSHLAGLLAERWIEAGYSVLVLHPEGDHTALTTLRGVRVVDGADRLPVPREVVPLLRQRFSSVVVDLSTLPREDAAGYVIGLRPAVQTERAVRGIPHWVVVDEAHLPAERLRPEHASGTCQQGCLPGHLPAGRAARGRPGGHRRDPHRDRAGPPGAAHWGGDTVLGDAEQPRRDRRVPRRPPPPCAPRTQVPDDAAAFPALVPLHQRRLWPGPGCRQPRRVRPPPAPRRARRARFPPRPRRLLPVDLGGLAGRDAG